ncbi:unnamed protein product [marine sediment metagenome]|uniref:Uncharacterized protein n=1 Tax=marine sediment metagenome TaxID=412755 RepID=X0THR8_9ZZZZ
MTREKTPPQYLFPHAYLERAHHRLKLTSARYWFESEFPSANTHCISSYPQLFAYLSIVKTLRMEFDKLPVREQAFTVAMDFEF